MSQRQGGIIRQELKEYVNSHPKESTCQEMSNRNFGKHFSSLKFSKEHKDETCEHYKRGNSQPSPQAFVVTLSPDSLCF